MERTKAQKRPRLPAEPPRKTDRKRDHRRRRDSQEGASDSEDSEDLRYRLDFNQQALDPSMARWQARSDAMQALAKVMAIDGVRASEKAATIEFQGELLAFQMEEDTLREDVQAAIAADQRRLRQRKGR